VKIELDIPDWTDNHALYIFSGIELVAYRNKDGKFHVKTGRCNMCGICCTGLTRHSLPLTEDGTCIHLKKEVGDNPRWKCDLGINRPFGCSIGIPINTPECTEEYEVLE